MPTTTEQPPDTKKKGLRRPKIEQMPPPSAETQESPSPVDASIDEVGLPDEPEAPEPGFPHPAKRGRPKAGEIRSPATAFFERNNATPNFRETSQYWGYRLEPITDLVATGRDKYVGIFEEPLDEDKILKHPHFGSGVYMFMFKTRNEQGQMILKEKLDRVDIENPAYPPCIPAGAWLTDRRNVRWEWAKKIYDEQSKEEARKNAPPSATPMSEVISVVREVLDARLPPTTGPKEDTVLNAVRTGVEMARASVPQGENAIVTVMREALADSRDKANKLEDRVLNLLTERTTKPAEEKPVDPIEVVANSIERLDKIRPPNRYRPADPEHPGWGILNTFVAGITPALGGLVTMLTHKLAQSGQPQPQRQPAPQPKQKPAPELPPPTPPPGAPAAEAPPGAEPVFDMSLIPPVLRDHFMTALMWANRGDSGADFADWLSATWPDAVIAMRSIGSEPDMPWSGKSPVDAMIWIAQQIPPIWAQISSVPGAEKRLRQFISEILAWTPQAEPQEPEEPEGSETTLQ